MESPPENEKKRQIVNKHDKLYCSEINCLIYWLWVLGLLSLTTKNERSLTHITYVMCSYTKEKVQVFSGDAMGKSEDYKYSATPLIYQPSVG